jgi:hypothetical protein
MEALILHIIKKYHITQKIHHLKLVGMFMIYLHIQFYIINCNSYSVITTRLKAEHSFIHSFI